MKTKCYILTYQDYDNESEEKRIEAVFKKSKDAKRYMKKIITDLLLDVTHYTNGTKDKEFKKDYEDEEEKYNIEEGELK